MDATNGAGWVGHLDSRRLPTRRRSACLLPSEAVDHPPGEAEAVLQARAEPGHYVVAGKAQSDRGGEIVFADQAGVNGKAPAIG